jgi:hypothetical protein
MALNNVSLNKFLKISRRKLQHRISLIRRDAVDAVKKEKKLLDEDGGDFYGAFWSDAKLFVLDGENLSLAVRARINDHSSKKNLYPALERGFFRWYDERFDRSDYKTRKRIDKAYGSCRSLDKDGVLRVHGTLAWQDNSGRVFIVYPYFDKDLALGERSARLARWVMADAMPDFSVADMIIVDVLRGNAFDNDNSPILGDEEAVLVDQYSRMLREWESQKRSLRF